MKDKGFLLCFSALTVLVSGMVSARGYRDMTLEYEHSMRLENKVIVISLEEIAPRLSENEELTAKGVVWIDGVERPEYARVLEAQEFDQLFSKFLDLDIKDMVNYGAGVPGDGTITYGYGIVVGRGDEISDELRQKYPPMSEEDATAQLRAAVAERARYVSNKLANRGLRATQQEFDAFVLDEYQSGDSSPLMERAQSLETLEELIQLFQRPSTIYPGLLKRWEAEARVYFEGDYSENFSY